MTSCRLQSNYSSMAGQQCYVPLGRHLVKAGDKPQPLNTVGFSATAELVVRTVVQLLKGHGALRGSLFSGARLNHCWWRAIKFTTSDVCTLCAYAIYNGALCRPKLMWVVITNAFNALRLFHRKQNNLLLTWQRIDRQSLVYHNAF